MGCGISRFHHHHGLHRHSPTTEYIGDDHHSDINITKNGSRLLFFAYHGEDDCRRSISSPLSPIHLKHITRMESPVVQGNVGRRKAAEACSDAAANHNPDLERKKSDTKLYINNHNIGEEDDDDYDPRLSICNNNMEDINGINGGASPMFMGSPSFREYCFVNCRSADDDNLIKSSHVNDIGKETEETQRREDDIRASHEGSARSSNSSSVVGMKKTRGMRRLRKGGSPSHCHSHSQRHRPGAVRRSLMNVASCYHPAPDHHNQSTYSLPFAQYQLHLQITTT